ncbi:hypothetical protein FO440_21995 [Mucilaginibacter corticis]|uniref:Uncharacterized protein n=1 Tax=Mucilaginibacter corticis TaxID=2597670 RepID=A0A556M9B1_9SPHI|nr:hypothetical protein [Mucilaginibacter corticis]TSJ36507.1 hypothetical protein FO440_21995 [Mucilaginibacter corticis]
MMFNWQLKVSFEINGKQHQLTFDKIIIKGNRPEKFYRVPAKKGNVDLIKHNNQWLITNGQYHLSYEMVDAPGEGIERAVRNEELNLD